MLNIWKQQQDKNNPKILIIKTPDFMTEEPKMKEESKQKAETKLQHKVCVCACTGTVSGEIKHLFCWAAVEVYTCKHIWLTAAHSQMKALQVVNKTSLSRPPPCTSSLFPALWKVCDSLIKPVCNPTPTPPPHAQPTSLRTSVHLPGPTACGSSAIRPLLR